MQRSRANTKEAKLNSILDAATELLVEKPTASLVEIAEYAGIGIATLHRYITSREQLMLQLGLRAARVVEEEMAAIAHEDAATYIARLVEVLVPLGDKIHFLANEASLSNNAEMAEAEERVKEPVRRNIERLQADGFFRQELSVDWILEVFYGIVFVTWQQVQQGHVAKQSAAGLLLDTLLRGVSGDKEPAT